MRIAILSSLYYETTFPLVKYLSKSLHVDLYCFVSKTFLTMPMMDLSNSIKSEFGLYGNNKVIEFLPINVKQYFLNTNVSLNLVIWSGGKRINHDIKTIFQISKEINSNAYDVIHFIGENIYFPLVYPFIKNKTIVHSFHENLTRTLNGKSLIKRELLKRLFRVVIRRSKGIIFHSENVQKQFLIENKDIELIKTKVIPFGLMEGYKFFRGDESLILPKKPYILFYGYIENYKGVDVFLDAITKLNKNGRDFDFVIAGRDAIGIDSKTLPRNVTFINKFLTEDEIVTLIQNCYVVVMPYKSASQSGIPHTTFVFNKPVISSRLEGLNEIIKEGVNGLFFEPNNYIDLSNKIVKISEDNKLYRNMVSNIEKHVSIENLTWETIASLTLDLYK